MKRKCDRGNSDLTSSFSQKHVRIVIHLMANKHHTLYRCGVLMKGRASFKPDLGIRERTCAAHGSDPSLAGDGRDGRTESCRLGFAQIDLSSRERRYLSEQDCG